MARLDPRALIPSTVFQLMCLILSIQNLKLIAFKLHVRSSCERNRHTYTLTVMEGYGKRVISLETRLDECEVRFEMLGLQWMTVITF